LRERKRVRGVIKGMNETYGKRDLHYRALLALLFCALAPATVTDVWLILSFIVKGSVDLQGVSLPWTLSISLGVPVIFAWITFAGLVRKKEWAAKCSMVIGGAGLVWVAEKMVRMVIGGGGHMLHDQVNLFGIQTSGDSIRWTSEILIAVILAWSIAVFYFSLSYSDALRRETESSIEPDSAR
jgi:hypothetical protein